MKKKYKSVMFKLASRKDGPTLVLVILLAVFFIGVLVG